MVADQDDDIELIATDMTLDEAAQEIVASIDFHTGMLVMPEEFSDFTQVRSGERVETMDCMVVTFNTIDHESHKYTLLFDDVIDMTKHFVSWLKDLHEAGRCNCGDHDDPIS